jgi:YD repeat-containing protein
MGTYQSGLPRIPTNTYDADGRLVKTTTGKSGEPATESLYTYDDVGRLLSITSNPQAGGRTDFRYDAEGRKIAIQTFDAETLQRTRMSRMGVRYRVTLKADSIAL